MFLWSGVLWNFVVSLLVNLAAHDSFKYVCYGTQAVAKFNEHGATNTVTVFVCCLRIPALATDIVLSLNAPSAISPLSSSAEGLDAAAAQAAAAASLGLFQQLMASFVVRDLSFIVP